MTSNPPNRRDVQILIGEARRYLAAVDAFRAECCEPQWRPEREPVPTRVRGRARTPLAAPPIP